MKMVGWGEKERERDQIENRKRVFFIVILVFHILCFHNNKSEGITVYFLI